MRSYVLNTYFYYYRREIAQSYKKASKQYEKLANNGYPKGQNNWENAIIMEVVKAKLWKKILKKSVNKGCVEPIPISLFGSLNSKIFKYICLKVEQYIGVKWESGFIHRREIQDKRNSDEAMG